jgi:hypothetical protein
MGLDVHAASHLRYVGPMPSYEERDRLEQELDKQKKLMDEVYFFLSANDRAHKARLDGMKPGLYQYTERSRQHGFRAGSYSGYNLWRRLLSRFAHGVEPEEVWEHPRRYRGKPFVELIDFTDCDGRIGTKVAARLAKDFRDHAGRIAEFGAKLNAEEREYWLEVYGEFTKAFELAGQDGALRFC